jgi:hypothetical protein
LFVIKFQLCGWRGHPTVAIGIEARDQLAFFGFAGNDGTLT